MATRGGKREGAGRKKNEAEDPTLGKGFASRVLDKIKSLKMAGIESADDYALDILKARDAESKSFFKLLLAYQLGKPVQPTIVADTRENIPLQRGDLPSHFRESKAANVSGTDKPN
jgi:hypothetical protein